MLRRWLSKNRLLAQILAGLLLFVVGMPAAGLAEELGREPYSTNFTEWDVLRAMDQYGAESPEAMDAMRLVGEGDRPVDLVALLDPVSLRVLSAWPAENKGRLPQELTIAGGAALPEAAALRVKFNQSVTTDRPDGKRPGWLSPWRTDRLETQVRQIYRSIDTGSLTFSQSSFLPNAVGAMPRVVVIQGAPADEKARLQMLQEELKKQRAEVRPLPPVAILLVASPPRGFTAAELLFWVFVALAFGGLVLYWLSTAWWVFADASRRGARAVAWGLLVLLTNVVGVLAYLIARPDRFACPSCGAPVERHHAHCPSCGRRLKDLCSACGMALQKNWRYCPGCGTPVDAAPAGEDKSAG